MNTRAYKEEQFKIMLEFEREAHRKAQVRRENTRRVLIEKINNFPVIDGYFQIALNKNR